MADKNTPVFANTDLSNYHGSSEETTLVDSTELFDVSVSLYKVKKKFNDETGSTQILSGLRVEFERGADIWTVEQESGNLGTGEVTGFVNKQARYDPEAVREFILEAIATGRSGEYFSEDAANRIVSDLEIPKTYPV
jgi:hypothetical protein